MSRRTSNSLHFDTLRLEGGLFVPELLEKAARGEHRLQKEADYQIPKGLKLHEEYGRAYRIAQAAWKNFDPVRRRADIDALQATSGFVREILRDCLGYADIRVEETPVEISGRGYPIRFMVQGRVPVVVAPHDLELDEPDPRFAVIGSGTRKKSVYQLAQQFLNANSACTWAIVSNGRAIRLLRDADTLTRPSFLELDLETILGDKDRYADFSALWRLLHASRAGNPEAAGSDCIWEAWKADGHAQGVRVREGLRVGVTQALVALGEGFLQQRQNQELRRRLQSGELSVDGFFQELLRLVYRFLFLFKVEERDLLHVEDDSREALAARQAYEEGYALRRLRDRALRRAGFDNYGDLWDGIRIVFRGLAAGEPRLALPALGGLFAPGQCPNLDGAALTNRALLTAMRHLRWSAATGSLSAVDYRNMGPEELGSVYESLLELVPSVDLAARTFGFVGLTDGGSIAGNARKTTGSYYTPDSLVRELISSALDPVIEARLAEHPDNPVEALLSINVIDPACGSGHFLLAAARRLAERLAELQAVEGAVRTADYRHALRQVIAQCIHGVDRNPMALELARTALWLEGYEPGPALSFLDHHLVCGDALLGVSDFKQLTGGIPDVAYTALAGDDKAVCTKLKKQNREARKTLEKLREGPDLFAPEEWKDVFEELEALEDLPDDTPEETEAKEAAYATFLEHARNSRLAHAADLFVGAFLATKAGEEAIENTPTTASMIAALFPGQPSAGLDRQLAHARQLCTEARVLHWPLAFAQVFAKGGFDCVLGNPPWERIKLQEEEFFAARHPDIATARNKAERGKRIALLETGDLAESLHPEIAGTSANRSAEQRLFREYLHALRVAEAASLYSHVKGEDGGRYPLTGIGDVNTYALFAETIDRLTRADGRAGMIVPTGIATDDSTKQFFSSLIGRRRLVSLFDFVNTLGFFPTIDRQIKFCLLTIGQTDEAEFASFLTEAESLSNPQYRFRLKAEDFRLINPNTRTCPVFRSNADAEITKKIYRNVPVLIKEATADQPEKNPWGISFMRMLDMANDSGLFQENEGSRMLPLYEAKMIHQFDHRWASYRSKDGKEIPEDVPTEQKQDPDFTVRPRYWVHEREVLGRIARVPRSLARAWLAEDETAMLYALANWIDSALEEMDAGPLFGANARKRVCSTGGALFEELPQAEADWRDERIRAEGREVGPLTEMEIEDIRSSGVLVEAVHQLLNARSPRWLMGWRDITKAANERTVIASVLPRAGAGDTLLLMYPTVEDVRRCAALLADQNSLVHDFAARQKVGGTHLKYHVKKQLPNLRPDAYSESDLSFIVPRVLELTYTSHELKPWAEDLGYDGEPFGFDPERRARLRAELDAYYARLYGLNRDELRYILDPADTHGAEYPSETFRVLKNNEMKRHGEYRTQRLVLEAWDALAEVDEVGVATRPAARSRMTEEDYLHELIPALLRQGEEDRLDWKRFVRAVCFLAKPSKLVAAASDNGIGRADQWKTTSPPGFDLTQVVPAIRELGGENLAIETVGANRFLVLKHRAAPESEESVKFDAEVAMAVVRAESAVVAFEPDEADLDQSFGSLKKELA